MARVVVLGAGVSGLSSTLRLLQAGQAVEVLASELSPNTTSDMAAAMWWPFHAEPAELAERWCRASYREFARLAADTSTGVVMRSGVFGFPGDVPPRWATAIPGAVSASRSDPPDGCVSGVLVTAPMVEMNRYMPWLVATVQRMGGRIRQQTLESFDEVVRPVDVIVNTTGLGANALTGDTELFPVRGRIIRVAQVGIERFVGSEAGEWPTQIFPRAHDVVLGGTHEVGLDELDVTPEVDDDIVERCVAIEPRRPLQNVSAVRRDYDRHAARFDLKQKSPAAYQSFTTTVTEAAA